MTREGEQPLFLFRYRGWLLRHLPSHAAQFAREEQVPFFFFKQDGKVRLSYDGKVLPESFDQAPYYGCCDSEMYNPRGGGQMVSFFGRRDGQWYYADMGDMNRVEGRLRFASGPNWIDWRRAPEWGCPGVRHRRPR